MDGRLCFVGFFCRTEFEELVEKASCTTLYVKVIKLETS